MASSEPTPVFRIALRLGTRWANVEFVRTMVVNCVNVAFGERDFSEVVGTVTSELLENAIKYGDWGPPEALLHLHVLGEDACVTVDVAGPVAPDSDHLARLRATLEWIRSFPSPQDAYEARVVELARSPVPQGESRMGLVRAASEAASQLDSIADAADGLLHVRAVTPRVR